MSFDVLSHSAELFMKSFYQTFLADGPSALISVEQGRLALSRSPMRNTDYGVKIYLEDQIIPVLHCSKEASEEFCNSKSIAPFKLASCEAEDTQTEIFTGRENSILQLENWLTPPSPLKLLLKGMPGVGKSALMRHVADWWSKTGFTGPIICLPLTRPQFSQLTLVKLISYIGAAIGLDFNASPADAAVSELNSTSTLLILDSIDAVTWPSGEDGRQQKLLIRKYLSKLHQCPVVWVSRGDVAWLDGLRQATLELQPIRHFDAVALGLKLLNSPKLVAQISHNMMTDAQYFDQLIKLAYGNPLAVKIIVANFSSFRSSTYGSVGDYLEALLKYRPISLDDVYVQDNEESRALRFLLDFFEQPFPAPRQDMDFAEALAQLQVQPDHYLWRSNGISQASTDDLHLHLALSLMAFWGKLPVDFSTYVDVFVSLHMSRQVLPLKQYETFCGILWETLDAGTPLWSTLQQRAMKDQDNPQIGVLVQVLPTKANSACQDIRRALQTVLADFVTEDRFKPENYNLSPILTFVARTFLSDERICPVWFIETLNVAVSELICTLAFKKVESNFTPDQCRPILLNQMLISVVDDQFMTCIASAFSFTGSQIHSSRCWINAFLLRAASMHFARILLSQRMSKDFVHESVRIISELRIKCWNNESMGYDQEGQDTEEHKNDWRTCCSLETILVSFIPLAMTVCCVTAQDCDAYVQAWTLFISAPPMYTEYRALRIASRQTHKTLQDYRTAWMQTELGEKGSMAADELQRLREEHLVAIRTMNGPQFTNLPDTSKGLISYLKNKDTLRPQDCSFDPTEQKLLYIFRDEHPFLPMSTAQIQEQISKLLELLQNDLSAEGSNRPWWRRRINRELVFANRQIGYYLRASNHLRAQQEAERLIDPAVLEWIKQGERRGAKDWEEYRKSQKNEPKVWAEYKRINEDFIARERSDLEKAEQEDSHEIMNLTRKHRIAYALADIHRYQESIPLFEEVIAGRRKLFRIQDEGVVEPILDMIKVYTQMNQYEKGIPLLRELFAEIAKRDDIDISCHDFYLRARVILAELLFRKARASRSSHAEPWHKELLAESRTHFEVCHASYKESGGEQGLEALAQLHNLAMVAMEQRNFTQAASLEEGVITARRALLPSDEEANSDVITLKAREVLAQVFFWTGKITEAETMLLDLVSRRLQQQGPDHPWPQATISTLGYLYESEARWEEARGLAIEHFQWLRKYGLLFKNESGYTFGCQSLGWLGREEEGEGSIHRG